MSKIVGIVAMLALIILGGCVPRGVQKGQDGDFWLATAKIESTTPTKDGKGCTLYYLGKSIISDNTASYDVTVNKTCAEVAKMMNNKATIYIPKNGIYQVDKN